MVDTNKIKINAVRRERGRPVNWPAPMERVEWEERLSVS